jgi:plastocyanin
VSTHHQHHVAAGLCALVAVMGLTSACGSSKGSAGGASKSSGSSTSVGSGTTAPDTVEVKNFSFTPQNITVNVGTRITWTFEDTAAHNVTADDGSFKSTDLSRGGTYSFTFNTAGKYSYICTIHQYMKGTVTVR